jgi:butyryl-CoA dehydrogenase
MRANASRWAGHHRLSGREAHAADDAIVDRAARAICYATGVALDRSLRVEGRGRAQSASSAASLLTPVAKAFSTDIGVEVARSASRYGGMGFIEETGAAQHYRDARIAAIYEGTNVSRRSTRDAQGAARRRQHGRLYIDELRRP